MMILRYIFVRNFRHKNPVANCQRPKQKKHRVWFSSQFVFFNEFCWKLKHSIMGNGNYISQWYWWSKFTKKLYNIFDKHTCLQPEGPTWRDGQGKCSAQLICNIIEKYKMLRTWTWYRNCIFYLFNPSNFKYIFWQNSNIEKCDKANIFFIILISTIKKCILK